jgi:hypothetical protein
MLHLLAAEDQIWHQEIAQQLLAVELAIAHLMEIEQRHQHQPLLAGTGLQQIA